MLEENVRQKCIFLSSEVKDLYWQYMIKFGKNCADFMEPKFDAQCAEETMSTVGIDKTNVQDCMNNVFLSKFKF